MMEKKKKTLLVSGSVTKTMTTGRVTYFNQGYFVNPFNELLKVKSVNWFCKFPPTATINDVNHDIVFSFVDLFGNPISQNPAIVSSGVNIEPNGVFYLSRSNSSVIIENDLFVGGVSFDQLLVFGSAALSGIIVDIGLTVEFEKEYMDF